MYTDRENRKNVCYNFTRMIFHLMNNTFNVKTATIKDVPKAKKIYSVYRNH